MTGGPINVTQPTMPPLAEFVGYLEQIWTRKILTNGGPLHQQLERALCDYLGVEQISLFNNGTNALMTALQSLGVSGEVITTPFSFVATAHSLLWRGLTPVFVDVDARTLNLDAGLIERAITPRTTGILPVHCYGQPCDVHAIERIARARGLKVLYDAAHAFGVELEGASVLRHGDLAVLSFHATKVFNTFEGGAIVSHDAATKARIDSLKNFGIEDELRITEAGLNGKMSEVNAAFGLVQLPRVAAAIERRREVDALYRRLLAEVPGIHCIAMPVEARGANYSYFPVLVTEAFGISRDALHAGLRTRGINARRYFFPLLSDLPMYRHLPSADRANLPVAVDAAARVLCLPIFPDLAEQQVHAIVAAIADHRA